MICILEEQYDVHPDEIGGIITYCSFISELFVLSLTLVQGLILDTIGRKVPIVTGLYIAGAGILGTPWFS
jgi:hypothetical protein